MKCGGGSHPHCVKTVLNKCQTCTQNISYTNKLEDKSFGYKCDSESDKKKKRKKKGNYVAFLVTFSTLYFTNVTCGKQRRTTQDFPMLGQIGNSNTHLRIHRSSANMIDILVIIYFLNTS